MLLAMSTYVVNLDSTQAERLRLELIARDFDMTRPPHTLFAGKQEGLSCVLYESGKLVVQGKHKQEFIEFFLEPEILQAFTTAQPPPAPLDAAGRIGIDESGKGDLYGPLCIAGVYAEGATIAALQQMGVRDSKKLTDARAAALAKKIRGLCHYHIVRISPTKYNQLYAGFKNLNRLLAWGHATAIEELAKETGCHRVIVDQFAAEHIVETALARKGLEVHLTQRHRAEDDLVVAAASILARHAFLEGLEKLSHEVGIRLPKGCGSAVREVGRSLIARHGQAILDRVSKTHFKTIQDILS
jgi:ribonuclease HIII